MYSWWRLSWIWKDWMLLKKIKQMLGVL
jgi:hypothetical protein